MNSKVAEVRLETKDLRERFPEFEHIFTEEMIIEIETEMITNLKNNLKNRKGQILNFMVEKFN